MRLLKSTATKTLLLCGRGAGKSYICAALTLLTLLQGKNVLLGGQRYDTLHDTLFAEIKTMALEWGIYDRIEWRESPMMMTFGEAHVFIATYAAKESVRGYSNVELMILDEMFLADEDIFAVWGPVQRGPKVEHPRIVGATTPRPDSIWNVKFADPDCDWEIIRATTRDNTYITDEQFRLIVSNIPNEMMYKSEILGELILDGGQTAVINLTDFTTSIQPYHDDGVYAGLDMAHKGQRDGHVFCAVQGNRLLALHEFGKCEHIEVAMWIKRFNERYKIKSLAMDMAFSEAVWEQLRYSIPCRQVSFSEKAPTEEDQKRYANIRAWGYFNLARQTKDGLVWDVEGEFIDKDIVSELKREVCNTHFLMDRMNRILIEDKDIIRARLGRSPDVGDSAMLACLGRPCLMDPTLVAHHQIEDSKYRRELEQIMSED